MQCMMLEWVLGGEKTVKDMTSGTWENLNMDCSETIFYPWLNFLTIITILWLYRTSVSILLPAGQIQLPSIVT